MPDHQCRARPQLEAAHVVPRVGGDKRDVDSARDFQCPTQPLEALEVIGPDEGREGKPALRARRVHGREVTAGALRDVGQRSPLCLISCDDSLGDEAIDSERQPRGAPDLVKSHREPELPLHAAQQCGQAHSATDVVCLGHARERCGHGLPVRVDGREEGPTQPLPVSVVTRSSPTRRRQVDGHLGCLPRECQSMDCREEAQRDHVAHPGIGVGREQGVQGLDVRPFRDAPRQVGVGRRLQPIAGGGDVEEDLSDPGSTVAAGLHHASVGAPWPGGSTEPPLSG